MRKYDPSQSIRPSTYNFKILRQDWISDNNCMLADKRHLWEAVLLFCDEDISFFGHTKWSMKHSGSEVTNEVRPKILDRKFLKLWTIQALLPLYARTDTQALFTMCLPDGWILFSFFIYLDTYWSLSTQERRIQQDSSGNQSEYSDGMHPSLITYDAGQMRHWREPL